MNERTELTREDPKNPFQRKEDELAKTAAADAESARAVAQVQAALVIAKRFPRKSVECMDLILQDCTLPKLAEAATYDYVRGGTSITGATIRLAEAICRRWGNIETGVMELSRHEGYSECLAYAWDLESGYRDTKTFQVRHWRDTKTGGYALTDERDLYELVANMGARRKRSCILSVIPMDVIETAVSQCEKTMRSKIEITDELIVSLLEKFAKHKVTKEMIETRIQRRLAKESLTPALVAQLGKIYNSLEDGMSNITDWFKNGAAPAETTASGRKRPKSKKGKEPTPQPEQKTEEPATEDALNFILKKASAATISGTEILKAFKLEKLADLKKSQVPLVLKWLEDPAAGVPAAA